MLPFCSNVNQSIGKRSRINIKSTKTFKDTKQQIKNINFIKEQIEQINKLIRKRCYFIITSNIFLNTETLLRSKLALIFNQSISNISNPFQQIRKDPLQETQSGSKNKMQTLQYGNNMLQLKQSRTNQQPQQKRSNNWLLISPQEIILHGMLLTANFNIQNSHQHLSINFSIKSFLKGQQVPFMQIFPQKGNIMRGQIKKIRIKFAKQFKPQLNSNGSMSLKIYVNLNTEWNKQYMLANRMKGWNDIKNLPIEEYEVPIFISDEFLEIKQSIRNSVVFESQFGKVSQDVSSLYGNEKFQVPEIDVYSKNHFQYQMNKPKYSGLRQSFDRKSESYSEQKPFRSSINGRSQIKQVYYGNEPKVIESKIEPQYQLRRQRAQSMSQKYKSPTKNSPLQVKSPKITIGINNPFSSQPSNYQPYSDRKLPIKPKAGFDDSIYNNQDSQISILRSLQGRNSRVQQYNFQNHESQYKRNNSNMKEEQVFKDFKTVDHDFKTVDHEFDKSSNRFGQNSARETNKRSMEIIVLAIIAGFFVALGSNVARLFQ